MKELSAQVAVIGEGLNDSVMEEADYHVVLKSGLNQFTRTPLYMPFSHVLGLKLALSKGLNPDEPSNLSQVVKIN